MYIQYGICLSCYSRYGTVLIIKRFFLQFFLERIEPIYAPGLESKRVLREDLQILS